jgi:hypothetical protein
MSERGGLPLPAQPPKLPGFPSNTLPVEFAGFDGLNTHVNRVAIKDTELSICDGFMPFGPSYLLALPGTGPTFWSAPSSLQIVFYAFGNIADETVLIALLSDGSVWQVPNPSATAPPAVSAQQILPPGTIVNPNSVFGFSQWGSQYIILAAQQPNGYWLWDGMVLYGAGGLGPVVTITNSGMNYTFQPTFMLQTTGGGHGATFSADFSLGSLTKINVTNPGTGFAVGDFNVLTITGGGSDNSAAATAGLLIPGGGVTGVQVTNGGHSYSDTTYATITGDGTGASVSLTAQLGTITGIAILAPGFGYTFATINVIDPTSAGTGFAGVVELTGGQVGNTVVTSGGSGYVTIPIVTVIGDGQNATAVAQISGGAVTGVVMTNTGFGYTKVLLQFTGGNNGASATVSEMPFGVSGTAVEVAFSRVWVTNGGAGGDVPPKNRTLFSAPGDPSDFTASDGAGAFLGTDSFLRVGYHALRQTNGFLYLIGDSSLNYVSGVQTTSSGTPPVASTTFTNANADPQTGSPWPSSVQVFYRNIVFANASGIYVSYGGAVTKISDDLDGLFTAANKFSDLSGQLQNFSSAVAHLFDVTPCYLILLPITDQITGEITNKLLCWNGKKWFTSSQDRPMTMIATQEIDSVLTAWGSDGRSIFPIFTTPKSYPRAIQSKLWAVPSYFYTKTNLAFLGIAQSAYATLDVYLDSEVGQTGPFPVPITTATGVPTVFGPIPAGQSGRLLGMTVQTSMEQGAINSFTMIEQTFETNV